MRPPRTSGRRFRRADPMALVMPLPAVPHPPAAGDRLVIEIRQLEARVRELEATVRRERQRADAEARRADAAARSSEAAWRVAWPQGR